MRFAKLTDYDEIAKKETDDIQKLLETYLMMNLQLVLNG